MNFLSFACNEPEKSIIKIKKRLGANNAANAIEAVEAGRFSEAIEIILKYYDKAYMFGINRRPSKKIIYVGTDTDNIEVNAGKVLEAAAKITW